LRVRAPRQGRNPRQKTRLARAAAMFRPFGLLAETLSSDAKSPSRDDGGAALSPLKVLRTPPSPESLSRSPFAALLESPFDRAVRALNAIDHLNRLGFTVTAPRPRRPNNRSSCTRNRLDAETLLVIARLIAGQLRTAEQTKVVKAICAQSKRSPLFGRIERTAIHKRLHAAARSHGFSSFGQFLRVMATHEVANSQSTEIRPVVEPDRARTERPREGARRRRARRGGLRGSGVVKPKPPANE
jgi:hypothetical protein